MNVGLFILSSSSKIPCITVLSLMSCMQKVFFAVEVISVKCRHRLCTRLSCSNKILDFFKKAFGLRLFVRWTCIKIRQVSKNNEFVCYVLLYFPAFVFSLGSAVFVKL